MSDDPRKAWLHDACDRLLAELEPGAEIGMLTLMVNEPSGAAVGYGANPRNANITRIVVPDFRAWADGAMPGVIDANALGGGTDA